MASEAIAGECRPVPASSRSAAKKLSISFFMGGILLKCVVAGFAGTDTNDLFQVGDENLAVADLAGTRSIFDGFDHALDQTVVYGGLYLGLGQEVHHILGAAIQFGMALLATETCSLGNRDALDADGRECFAHFIELERFDD